MSTEAERFVSPGRLAGLLEVRPATVRRWASEGRIPAIRLPGGQFRFNIAEVLAALEGLRNRGGVQEGRPHAA